MAGKEGIFTALKHSDDYLFYLLIEDGLVRRLSRHWRWIGEHVSTFLESLSGVQPEFKALGEPDLDALVGTVR